MYHSSELVQRFQNVIHAIDNVQQIDCNSLYHYQVTFALFSIYCNWEKIDRQTRQIGHFSEDGFNAFVFFYINIRLDTVINKNPKV